MEVEQAVLCIGAVLMCNSLGISVITLAGTCLTGLLTLIIVFSFHGNKNRVPNIAYRSDKSGSIPRLPPLSAASSTDGQHVAQSTIQRTLPFSNPDKTLMELLMGEESTLNASRDQQSPEGSDVRNESSSTRRSQVATVIFKQLKDAGLQGANLQDHLSTKNDFEVLTSTDMSDGGDAAGKAMAKFLDSTAKDVIDWYSQEDSGLLFHVSLDNVMTTLDRSTIDVALAAADAKDFTEEHLFRCSTSCSRSGGEDDPDKSGPPDSHASGPSSDFMEGTLSPLRASVIPPGNVSTPLFGGRRIRSGTVIVSTYSPEPPEILAQEERDAMNSFGGSSTYKASAIISADLAHIAQEQSARRTQQTLHLNAQAMEEYAKYVEEGKHRVDSVRTKLTAPASGSALSREQQAALQAFETDLRAQATTISTVHRRVVDGIEHMQAAYACLQEGRDSCEKVTQLLTKFRDHVTATYGGKNSIGDKITEASARHNAQIHKLSAVLNNPLPGAGRSSADEWQLRAGMVRKWAAEKSADVRKTAQTVAQLTKSYADAAAKASTKAEATATAAATAASATASTTAATGGATAPQREPLQAKAPTVASSTHASGGSPSVAATRVDGTLSVVSDNASSIHRTLTAVLPALEAEKKALAKTDPTRKALQTLRRWINKLTTELSKVAEVYTQCLAILSQLHGRALLLAMYTLAQCIAKEGAQVSPNPKSTDQDQAFACAQLAASLCKYMGPRSGFRELLIGHFHLLAPLTTPVVPRKVRLYAAFLIALPVAPTDIMQLVQGQGMGAWSDVHVDVAWAWVARFMSDIVPQALLSANGVSANVLAAFLETVGWLLSAKYGRQFAKIIVYLEKHVLPRINGMIQAQWGAEPDPLVVAASARLTAVVTSAKTGQLKQPTGLLKLLQGSGR